MMSTAVVLKGPEQLELRRLALTPPQLAHLVVDVEFSAISTGTERLLWSGTMPTFPGMGYPLVPGYESVGRVVERIGCNAEEHTSSPNVGDRVFVPGASCFGDVRGLFGGAASRLLVPPGRVVRIDDSLAERGVLLALAATARHALVGGDGRPAELIIGHGVLGRLLARIAVAMGGSPVVWETNAGRASGAEGYVVVDPATDKRRDYRSIYDVSGDASLVDTLLARLARGGELTLAGFYAGRIDFDFAPAFMNEARLRIAAEWQKVDLDAVVELLAAGSLSLDGLITHRKLWTEAADAYVTAFTDPECLKMLIDWRTCP